MLSSLSSALQTALAPEVPPVVDFRRQWNLFLRYYAENKPLGHKSRPIESTKLVFHLNNMLRLLIEEQEGGHGGGMGACMEYLINHQVLDILSSLCQADTPPGIRPYIFNVFVFLVTQIRQNILPYVNVYLPVRRLLMLSCVWKASPTEGQELRFVSALVAKLKRDPQLLSLFAHDSRPGFSSHCSSRRSSNASTTAVDMALIRRMLEEEASRREDLFEKFETQHLVVAALINFLDSADYMVSFRAMESLLAVCQLNEQCSAESAVDATPLCAAVTDRLSNLFYAVTRDVSPSSVEEIRVNWMEEAHHLQQTAGVGAAGDAPGDFKGKPELVAFFCWLDYCDTLVKESVDVISSAVAAAIGEDFFVGCLERRLCEAVEADKAADIVLSLAYTSQCWLHIRSSGLANEFSAWLFGCCAAGHQPELSGVVTHPLKHTLLRRLCTSADQDVALEALRLFDVLLEHPTDRILQNLALCNLAGRGYYDGGLAESCIASWSDEEDERERQKSTERMMPSSEVTPTVSSRTLAPTNIARVVNKWLFLVPDEWRSSDSARDSGYEQYVRNAETQAADVFRQCRGFGEWPREAVSSADGSERDSSDSRVEADHRRFYEGDFLAVLFDMLEGILERDYDVNLQVTALLSRLALFPHPYLHEFLLNPTIPVASGARTLFSTLNLVLDKARRETEGIEQLQRKIYVCRKTLLGSESERLALNLTKRETKVIDGLIILEEFGKELAAITLVKYHMAC